MLRRVHELAPGVRLDTWPITTTLMETGHNLLGYDVLIGPEGFRADGDPEVLLRDRIVYVADPANPRLRASADGRWRLTAEDLAALPHAAARLPQAGAGHRGARPARRHPAGGGDHRAAGCRCRSWSPGPTWSPPSPSASPAG